MPFSMRSRKIGGSFQILSPKPDSVAGPAQRRPDDYADAEPIDACEAFNHFSLWRLVSI